MNLDVKMLRAVTEMHSEQHLVIIKVLQRIKHGGLRSTKAKKRGLWWGQSD